MANRVILLVEAGIEGQMPTELAKSNVEVVSGPDLLTELRDLCQDLRWTPLSRHFFELN